MEVTEQDADGLERKFTIKVPASELEEKLAKKLEDIKGKVHLKGFRKGKAPVSHLKKVYGKGMMGEIVQEVVQETSRKAFTDKDLQPASEPHPHFETNIDDVVAGKADLEYMIHAEVLPKFEPADVSELKLTRPVAEVSDNELDEALEKLAKQQKEYKPRKKTEKAKKDDMVVIDFVGKLEGEEFEGGKGEGHELVLGSGQFIPGFEEQLIGAKAETDVEVKVSFPDDYNAESLAGKEAVFDVKMVEVKAPEDVEINDEFAEKLGLEDLADLKKRITDRLTNDSNQLSRGHVKRALLDKLDEAHEFALPKGMVDAEFDQIWKQVEIAERDEEDKDKSDDELKDEYRKIAERRVRLGLVLAEIGKRADVQVPSTELQQAIQQQAMQEAQYMQMQGQDISPQQILQFYQQNPAAVQQVRAPLFEEKVVDYILERATVTDKKVSREELQKDPEGDDDAKN